jgi:predicted metal-dependent hydrolase
MSEAIHQIEVGNLSVDVIRKDIKNLHLAVYPPNGRVRVAAPLRINDEAVRLLVINRMPWIKRQQSKFDGQVRQTQREYVSGESHYFKGERYLLNVIYHDAPPSVEILNKTHINLYVRIGSPKAKREEIFTEWYREQLKNEIPDLVEKWSKITNTTIQDWQVKKMKTKWGTCNIAKKRIWLNLELAKKPLHSLEYVIAHEMTHLLERHHNDRFMALMDKFLPQWRFYREELNRSILGFEEWGY